MQKALITSIQRFSIHDGPGIRTAVFLKGCPLHCTWCHNPECISFEPEILFYPQKCIGCGQCEKGCYANARVPCGELKTTDEVLAEVLADRSYYGSNGGLTISGGEPLAHPDFTRELLTLCRQEGIGTAIETSLYRFDKDILQLCDVIMTDIKIMDAQLHLHHTGIPLSTVLENIKQADTLEIPLLVRTPIIPGINASRENVEQTAAFLKTLKNVQKYELLPYHLLGEEKSHALNKQQPIFTVPSKEQMEELKRYANLL